MLFFVKYTFYIYSIIIIAITNVANAFYPHILLL